MEAVVCSSKFCLVAKKTLRSQLVLANTQRELQAQRTRQHEAQALLGQTLQDQVRILNLSLLYATSGKILLYLLVRIRCNKPPSKSSCKRQNCTLPYSNWKQKEATNQPTTHCRQTALPGKKTTAVLYRSLLNVQKLCLWCHAVSRASWIRSSPKSKELLQR